MRRERAPDSAVCLRGCGERFRLGDEWRRIRTPAGGEAFIHDACVHPFWQALRASEVLENAEPSPSDTFDPGI